MKPNNNFKEIKKKEEKIQSKISLNESKIKYIESGLDNEPTRIILTPELKKKNNEN